jgi:hypothetical protein
MCLPITTDPVFFPSEMCVFYLTLLLNTDDPIVIVMYMFYLYFHKLQGIQRVSEWLLFNANSAIFQLYHQENMLIFNEMMEFHFVLDQHA